MKVLIDGKEVGHEIQKAGGLFFIRIPEPREENDAKNAEEGAKDGK